MPTGVLSSCVLHQGGSCVQTEVEEFMQLGKIVLFFFFLVECVEIHGRENKDFC